MTIAEIKRAPRNQDALQLLEAVTNQIKESPETTEVFILAKIDGNYHRFSSGIEDVMQLVATLELAKFDALQRMGG